MKLFVFRHGQAESQITTDEARNLTAKGRLDVENIIAAHVSLMQSLDCIWVSPLVRAQQTASIAAQHFPGVTLQTTDLLIPDASLQPLFDVLRRVHVKSILLVSHQPLVGRLVDSLCGKHDGYHSMGTGSLAAVEIDVVAAGLGNLLWLDHVV